MKRDKVKRLTLIAMAVSVTALISQISVPLPNGVPLTLQCFSIALCGFLLGTRDGTVAIIVYIALGAVGVPVFTGFGGGIQRLVSLTGGFIFGFIPYAAICGLVRSLKFKVSTVWAYVFGILGVICCHICGTIYFSIVGGTTLIASFVICSLPYLIKDMILTICAYHTSEALRKSGCL